MSNGDAQMIRNIYSRYIPEPWRREIRRAIKWFVKSPKKVFRLFFRRFKQYIKVRKEKAKNHQISNLLINILQQKDPVIAVNLFTSKSGNDRYVLWHALLQLHEKRHSAFDVVINNHDKIDDEEIFYLLEMKKYLSSPSMVSESQVPKYSEFYKNNRNRLQNEREYKRMLIALITKKLTSEKAFDAFSSAGIVEDISTHQVLKVLYKASMEGEIGVFENIKLKYLSEMVPAARSKVLYWEGKLKKNDFITYKDVENSFCCLDKKVSREYLEILSLLFEKIPDNRNFIDFNFREEKLWKIRELVSTAIKERQAFSFVRLNDGEGYGFPDSLFRRFDMDRQERHWWGEVLDPKLRDEIQKDFSESLNAHSLVGIPSVLRFIDELSINRDYSIHDNALIYRLFSLCHGYLSQYDGGVDVTEGQINLYLFDEKYIREISQLADRVCFISGASKNHLEEVFSDIDNAEYIEIPTHRLLKGETFSSSGFELPLPYVYKHYQEQIRTFARPGVVFFISAGFIGKIFAAEVAKNGGVALDVGQSLMNIVANHDNA